ncbi:MAG TPA: LysR substrate-binding domain-containing protein [Pseudomonas sp.]
MQWQRNAHQPAAHRFQQHNRSLPLLASFHKAVPQTRLNVSIDNSRLIAQQVAAFEIDMGLIEAPCHMLELLAEPWLDDKLLVVAAPRHPLASQGRLNHQKLRQAEWIFRETSSDTREEADYALLQHFAHFNVTIEIASSEAIKRCVAVGLGITCLSRRVVADLLESGQLRELTTVLPPLSRRFYLLRHKNKFVSPALKRFWLHCTEADTR